MLARSIIAVLAGAAVGALGRITADLVGGLKTCLGMNPEYTNYLVGKGYTVDTLLCPNTVPGTRLWAALSVFCLVLLLSGYVAGALARRSPIAHAIVAAALFVQITELQALWLGLVNAESNRALLIYAVPAMPFAAIGGYLASRRHA